MGKQRIDIPKAIKEKVLKEYKHKCAFCDEGNPQLHHIDENPLNNEAENLIPLCPTHHLSYQHNTTAKIPIYKMKLFREYKDTRILNEKFNSLYSRFMNSATRNRI